MKRRWLFIWVPTLVGFALMRRVRSFRDGEASAPGQGLAEEKGRL